MNTLDEKLKKIVRELTATHAQDLAITQIKEAFTDEGYIQPIPYSIYARGNSPTSMSGKEWYDKFEKELEMTPTVDKSPLKEVVLEIRGAILEAAKKASGIQDR